MESVIAVENLNKTYKSGHPALKNINLDIRKGEIFALLGPNGAGKTTLISIICGIVNPGEGKVRVAGHDIKADYRAARSAIGLVPQELVNEVFESVWATVRFSRGLFGKKPNDAYLQQLLKDLSLWDKRDAKIFELSGGMKRRRLNRAGKGSATIIESVPGERVRIQLEFLEPFRASNLAQFSFTAEGEATRVTWSMSGHNGFIGKAMGLVFNMDKMVGGDFEQGLASLKALVEAGK